MRKQFRCIILTYICAFALQIFPPLPKDLNESSFSYTLKDNSLYGLVLVNCPTNYSRYVINSKIYTFRKNGYNIKKELFETSENVWVAVAKKFNKTKVECGKFKDINYKHEISWNLEIIWKNREVNVDIILPYDIYKNPMKDKCGYNNVNLTILSVEKYNNFTMIQIENYKDIKLSASKTYYFFDGSRINSSESLLLPCGVVRLYEDMYKIKLEGLDYLEDSQIEHNIKVFRIPESGSITFKVDLRVFDPYLNSQLFKNFTFEVMDVEYNYKKMTYLRKKLFKIPFYLFVNEYKILEIRFKYLSEYGKEKRLRETIFFGPEDDNIFINDSLVEVNGDKDLILPNCEHDKISYAYLDKAIVYGSDEIFFQKRGFFGSNEEKLKSIIYNFKYFNITDRGKLDLQCIYKTPGGTITINKMYYRSDLVKITKNSDGYYVYTNIDNFLKTQEEMEKSNSWSEKYFEDIFDEIYTVLVLEGGFLVTLTFFMFFVLPVKYICLKLKELLRRRSIRKQYPNVYHLWNFIKSRGIENFCKMIYDKKYIPSTFKNLEEINESFNDETIIKYFYDNTFDNSLLETCKKLNNNLKLHYIKTPNRRYILSDAPDEVTIKDFFKMLYVENISLVVSIMDPFDFKYQLNLLEDNFFLKFGMKYGNFYFKRFAVGRDLTNNFSSWFYNISCDTGIYREVNFFCIRDWKEYDLLNECGQYYKNYKNMMSLCKDNVLIHSSSGSSTKAFMFAYFALICDNLESKKPFINPLDIIKDVRESRYGGYINDKEFAFVINFIITSYFDTQILYDTKSACINYYKEYKEYMKEFFEIEKPENQKISKILTFLNIINEEKMDDLWKLGSLFYLYSGKELNEMCKRFVNVLSSKNYCKKIRNLDIYCFDTGAICIGEKALDDPSGFFHANKIILKDCKEKEQIKLILSQAPTPEGEEDMIDIIYENKIDFVVILISLEESLGRKPSWRFYLPREKRTVNIKGYTVNRLFSKYYSDLSTSDIEYSIISNKNISHRFRVLHYENWPEDGLPTNISCISELCNIIRKDQNYLNILIHCGCGIGRTGTFALAYMIIHSVCYEDMFDPVKELKLLRKHRFGAVQTKKQFVFAIGVAVKYFKNEILENNSKKYYKFLELIEKICY
uniref:Protein-tyrosine-phosphatase n=1 Tax=Parastrongyloides trichosuri TaxID=131310 RepID=A0A0N4Z9S9_PARTI